MVLLAISTLMLQAAPNLVPKPAHLELHSGLFRLSATTRILAPPGTEPIAALLAGWLGGDTGLEFTVRTQPSSAPNSIFLLLEESSDPKTAESYSLRVAADGVRIQAASRAGLVYACQSLRQLTEQREVPLVTIDDRPRFAWRGFMMDCSRTFQTTAQLKRTVELISYHKLNVLHLHLTDDQGWRIEIRKHPKLTTVGSQFAPRFAGERNGYYTQAEIRDLVRFAADRGVTIVPEIEMPGHATAALAAYPELSCTGGPFEVFPFFQGPSVTKDVFCAGNDATFRLLEDVLQEVADLFPGRFIHIGGDECPKDRWKACPKCQARMRAECLRDAEALQGYFVRRIAKFVAGRGKRVLGWDEILEGGLPQDAAVMFWRGLESAAAVAQSGHDMVLSPTDYCYLDYRQSDRPDERAEGSVLPIDKVYSFDPVPAAFEGRLGGHVLGAQGNMWTHYARTQDQIDRQMFPRLAALAEDFWTPQHLRRWDDFRERLKVHCARLDRMGVKMGINVKAGH